MSLSDNKRIAKNTLMLYFRMILLMGITLYTSRVVLNQLGVDDYGVYNVVGGVVTMLSFLNGSMAVATQRFIAYAIGKNDEELEKHTFGLAINIHCIISLILIILAESVGLWLFDNYLVIPQESRQSALVVFHFSILTAIVGILSVPFTSLVIAHERMSVYAYISLVEGGLKLGVAFLLILIPQNKLSLYAILVFIAAVIVALTWVTYCRRVFPRCRPSLYWNKDLFCHIFGFVGWQALAQISFLLSTQGVNILLNVFFGPVLNTARGIAVQVNAAIDSFSQNFQTASVPQINKLYASNERSAMNNLIIRSSKISFMLILMISVPILLETETILKIWLVDVPPFGVEFVRLIIVTSLVKVMSGTLLYGALATGKIRKYQIIMSLLVIMDPVLVYILFKVGCVPATIFYVEIGLNAITLFARLLLLKQMINLSISSYLKNVVLRDLIVLGCLCGLFCLWYSLGIYDKVGFLFNEISFIIFSVLTIYSLGFSSSERKWVGSLVGKFAQKFIKTT